MLLNGRACEGRLGDGHQRGVRVGAPSDGRASGIGQDGRAGSVVTLHAREHRRPRGDRGVDDDEDRRARHDDARRDERGRARVGEQRGQQRARERRGAPAARPALAAREREEAGTERSK